MEPATLYNFKALWTAHPINPVVGLTPQSQDRIFKGLTKNSDDEAHVFLASPELYKYVHFNTPVQVLNNIWAILIPNINLTDNQVSLYLES